MHFCTFAVVSNMSYFKGDFMRFPFDTSYSMVYDIILLFDKVVLVLLININALFLSDNSNNNSAVNVIYCLNYFAVLIPLINCGYVIYIICLNNHIYLTFQYNLANSVRIYLTLLLAVSILIKAVLLHNQLLFVVIFVIVIILSLIIFIYKFNIYVHNKVTHSSSIVGVLMYSLSNDIDLQSLICEWYIHHKFSCKLRYCTLCAQMNSIRKFSYKDFFTLLYNEIQRRSNVNNDNFNDYKDYYLEFIDVVNYVLSEQTQRIIFYYMFFNTLEKYKNSSVCLYYNLVLIFDYVSAGRKEFEKSYMDFIQSEHLANMINSFLIDFEDFLYYSTKTPDSVFTIAKKYTLLSTNDELTHFLSLTNNEYSYQCIILRYVYETICNMPLKGNQEFFDVTLYNEFNDYHYRTDKMLLVKYSLLANSAVILKAGGELKSFTKKPFDSLFTKNIRNNAITTFIQLINNNDFQDERNVFEYVIKQNECVVSFQYKYIIYPSIETDEMIISGDYVIGKDDVLIFKKSNDYREYLYSFSAGFKKVFILIPQIFQHLSLNGKRFVFDDLFYKNKSENECCSVNNNGREMYNIHYDIFIEMLNDFIKEDNGDECNELIYETLSANEINNTNTCDIKINKNFNMEKKFIIDTDNAEYTVYYVDIITNEINLNVANVERTNDSNKHEQIFNRTSHIHKAEGTLLQLASCMDSVSVSCYSSVASKSSTLVTRIKFKKTAAIEKSTMKHIFNYVRSIAIFCIFLVLTCIIFLIIEIVCINHFTHLFFVYQQYLFFKINIELQPLRLFSNLCLAIEPNSTECVQPYKTFSNKLYTPNNTSLPLINEVIFYEMIALMDNIESSLIHIQRNLYDMRSSELLTILHNKYVNMFFLDQVSSTNISVMNTVDITVQNISLLQALDIYSNFFTIVINSEKVSPFASTPIRYIWLNITSFILNTDILLASRLNEMNRNIYQIFINYPAMHKGLLEFQGYIEQSFVKDLKYIRRIIICFCVALFVLNLLLLLLCLKFISHYKKVLNQNYIKIITTLHNENYLKYVGNLINNMKELLQLYEEKPSTLVHLINENKETYIKQCKEEYKLYQHQQHLLQHRNSELNTNNDNIQSVFDSRSGDNNNNTTTTKTHLKQYNPIIKPFTNALIYGFVIYFLLFIAIFIAMLIMIIELQKLVDFTAINAQLDNYLYGNLNSFQISLIANISSYDTSYYIYNDSSINYILEGISQQYISLKQYELFIEKHFQYKSLHNSLNVSCATLHSVNNSNTYLVETEFQLNLSEFTEMICNKLIIMKYNNALLILKEICYILDKLTQLDIIVKYNMKQHILQIDEVFIVYTLVLIINQYIRGYYNEIAIPNKVIEIINKFESTIVGCLILNALCEVTIGAMLMWFVMRKMVLLNKVFTHFMKFLD